MAERCVVSRCVALSALIAAVGACGALDEDPPPDCPNLSCLEANRPYDYRPTREARRPIPAVAEGAVALSESAYEDIEVEQTHSVTFSTDRMQVELVSNESGERLLGTSQDDAQLSDRIVYHLDAFAGGVFIVWWDKSELAAELTLFGSGVPITSSNRGVLTSHRAKD